MSPSASIAISGVGVVGARVARQLTSSGMSVLLHDERRDAQASLARSIRASELADLAKLDPATTPIVVIATSSPQAPLAKLLLELGHHVVCTSDDVEDTRELL